MKTIQELYKEVMENQELKEKFIEAANAGKQEDFLREMGCEATLDEVAAFLEAKSEEDAPLSLDELENSAGGNCATTRETVISCITAGLGCATMAIYSAAEKGYHFGQQNENDGRICNKN